MFDVLSSDMPGAKKPKHGGPVRCHTNGFLSAVKANVVYDVVLVDRIELAACVAKGSSSSIGLRLLRFA